MTDADGHYVQGLEQRQFEIREDGRPQVIAQFMSQAVPISLSVALDTSSSMRGERFVSARQAIATVAGALTASDEMIVFGFNDTPFSITAWTHSRDQVVMDMSSVEPVRAGGFTALYDGLYEALAGLKTASGRRRAVLVISDGNDEMPGDRRYRDDVQERNLSADARLRHARDDVRRAEAIVYAVGIEGHSKRELPLDEHALDAITTPTGGFTAVVRNASEIPRAVTRVLDDLRHEYLVAFVPTHGAEDRFHQLKVTVRGCTCTARTRSGYFATR